MSKLGEARRVLPRPSAPSVFVGVVWAAMVASTSCYIARYGTAMPKFDDLIMLDFLVPGARLDWTWVWSQHYEHRMPIPRVISHELVAITRDFRTGTWIELILLAALSLVMIFAARRIRGRTSYTDAFFPLLWLHWGHSDTLLNPFQMQVVLSTVVWCTAFLVLACGSTRPTFRALCVLVACALALPLCGMFGVLEDGALVLWLAFVGWNLRRSSGAEERRSSNAAFAGAIAISLLVAVYFIDFHFPPSPPRTDLLLTLSTTAQFLAASGAYAAQDAWPWSSCIAIVLCLASAILLVRVVRREADERLRAFGLLCCLASIACLALGIGWGRGIDQPRAGFLSRYAVASAPILCVVYFAWLRYGPRAAGRSVRIALCSAAIAFTLANIEPAEAIGKERAENARALTHDIDAGMSLAEVSRRHWRNFFFGEFVFTRALHEMRDAGLGPFERASRGRSGKYDMMWTQPSAVISERPIQSRTVQGATVLIVHPDGELSFELLPGASTARGTFGVFAKQFSKSPTGGVRFTVELANSVLFEQTLEPRQRAEDAGLHEFAVKIPEAASGDLVLRARRATPSAADVDWSFWTAIEIR